MKAKKFNQRILRAGKGSYFYIEIMILYSLFAKKNICLAVLRPKQLHNLCNRRTFPANSTQQFSVHKFLNGVPRSHSPLVIGLYFTNFEFYAILLQLDLSRSTHASSPEHQHEEDTRLLFGILQKLRWLAKWGQFKLNSSSVRNSYESEK